MKAEVLRGSKAQIVEKLTNLNGMIVEAIVLLEEVEAATEQLIEEDIFAEMDAFVSHATDVDDSREAIYTRMEGARCKPKY